MESEITIAIPEPGQGLSPWRELRLPADVCKKMEQRLQGSQFPSLEEFLTFVMREISSSDTSKIKSKERELLEQRLRDLGYM